MATQFVIFTFFALFLVQLAVFTNAAPTEGLRGDTKTDIFDGIEKSQIVHRSNGDIESSKTLSNVGQREVAEEKKDKATKGPKPSPVHDSGRFEMTSADREQAEEKEVHADQGAKVVPVKEGRESKTGLIYSSREAGSDEQTLDKTLKTFSTSMRNEVLADIFNAKSDNPKLLSTSSRYACSSFYAYYRSYTQRFVVSTNLWHVRYATLGGYCHGKIFYSGRYITVYPYCFARIYYFRS